MDDATEDPEHSAPGANSTLDPAASTRQTAGSERLVQQVLARRQAAFHGPDREPWRRDVQGGGARAAVFGVSDGLVSNVSLILGFAGAMPQPGVVRLAASPVCSPVPARWLPGSTSRCARRPSCSNAN
jgi:hypothetical protein